MRAGLTNMFQSAPFRDALSGTSGCAIELYHTDGAEGAARGAALGASFFASPPEAFAGLEQAGVVEPDGEREASYQEAYRRWLDGLSLQLR
jgi:xylulokinase